jgi:hypothetical protein
MTILPALLSDHQATALSEAVKAGRVSIEAARSFVEFMSKTMGTIPEDLVGLYVGDPLRAKRIENGVRLKARLDRLREQEARSFDAEVPLSVGLPLFEAATDESREELVDLWARLLAAAMDHQRQHDVRGPFIGIVKKLDPIDARVLQHLARAGPQNRDLIARDLGIRSSQVEVSYNNLFDLGLLFPMGIPNAADRPQQFGACYLSATALELMRVLSD